MRPDMLLCTQDWEVLSIANGVPVHFNDIVALASRAVDESSANTLGTSRESVVRKFKIGPNRRLGPPLLGEEYPGAFFRSLRAAGTD